MSSIEMKGIEVPLILTWEFPQEYKITLYIEIEETGQKTEVTCDWDPEDVCFLNPKQLSMMYNNEIFDAVYAFFDPTEMKPEFDDFEDFYKDKF